MVTGGDGSQSSEFLTKVCLPVAFGRSRLKTSREFTQIQTVRTGPNLATHCSGKVFMLMFKRILMSGVVAAFAIAFAAAPAAGSELNCTSGTCTFSGATQTDFVTQSGVTYTSFAGALWTTTITQATGSGVIDSFVRISDNGDVVSGMNTSYRPTNQGNENNSLTFTHDLTTSSVPVVTINGVQYLEFLLDINQMSSDPLLSLDSLEICTGASGGAYSSGSCVDTTSQQPNVPTTLRYSLDALGDNRVVLDYNINSGSGSGDLLVYIPVSTLGVPQDAYLYLWSEFGKSSGDPNTTYNNNDGYEEWAVRLAAPPTVVPEPASLLLLGTGLLVLARLRRRKVA
jgi:hypothetical protein